LKNQYYTLIVFISVVIIVKHTIVPFMEKRGQIWCSPAVLRLQYVARAFHAECLRLQTHTQNM